MSIFSLAFWRAALERAVKSAAQGAILAGVGVAKFDALHASWETIGGASLGAAILSVLTSVASDALTSGSGPSLTDAEVLPSSAPPTNDIQYVKIVGDAAALKGVRHGSRGPEGWQGPVTPTPPK